MLKLQNVSKYYYSKNNIVCALNHITIDFESSEFVAITGESGSGKSTLLNVLSGLDTFEEGHLFIQNEDMTHYSIDQLETYRNQYIGFVFQDYNIIESYTVYENVLAALLLKNLDQKTRIQRAKDLIEQVGLTHQINQKASTLSGGEKQRTVIARALAKDAPIIVCDEPTGNLDEETAKGILALLNSISEDKCVIVVTHNFDQIKSYATRKIRLYDGDIIEDQPLSSEHGDKAISTPLITKPTLKKLMTLSWFNVKNIPKKTGFMIIIIAFIIVAFMSAYAVMLDARNTVYQEQTDYFEHAMKERLIVTKKDASVFDEEAIRDIAQLDHVLGVTQQDLIYDLLLSSAWEDADLETTMFDHYYVYPSVILKDSDLVSGRLPTAPDEIVIGLNDAFNLNDFVAFSPRHMIKEVNGATTDLFVKKIVGFVAKPERLDDVNFMYFTEAGLKELEPVSNYKYARTYLDVDGVRQYVLTPDIRIDNTLDEGVLKIYDMLFFDVCRDFGYKEEIIDDFDAGLCPVEEFLPNHSFSLSVITRFENKPITTPIDIINTPMEPSILGQALYMNEQTFNTTFYDESYQITALVYDMYEAQIVKSKLEDMGYNAFYPAGVLDEEDAFDVLSERIQLSIGFLATTIIVYFVGYFVLRTLTYSKQKDYIILRSIGASKQNVFIIMLCEILSLTMVSFILVLSIGYIVSQYQPIMGDYIRYFNFKNLLLMLVSIIAMMVFMVKKINTHMFKESVITSLRVG